jgi:HPr kinase/phosphorylase
VVSWQPVNVSEPSITVEEFYKNHAEALELRLIAGATGLKRKIREGTVNRPGLALVGFYKYFADKRPQVFGSAETNYLHSLSKRLQRIRSRHLFRRAIPCVIFARALNPPKIFLEEAEKFCVPVFKCPMVTMRLVNRATIFLESDFAPVCNQHGSMVDILGIGVLVRGASGIGKSECVLSLLERGYSLVADDLTKIRLVNGCELVCTSPETSREHMEVRGIGIINVASMFGVGAIRTEKVLNIVTTLVEWEKVEDVDRLGIDRQYFDILGLKVPHVTIPIRPGRDIARLVEVAALDQKLKNLGHNTALEFNRRLIQNIQKET